MDELNANTTLLPDSESLMTPHQFFVFFSLTIIIRFFICLFGIVTNFLTIRAFYRSGLKDSTTVIFVYLAVMDLTHLILSFVHSIQGIVEIFENLFIVRFVFPSGLLGYVIFSLNRGFSDAVCLATTFMAVQRCLCVTMPLHFKAIFTRQRTLVILVIGFFLGMGFHTALLAQTKFQKVTLPPFNVTQYILVYRPARATMLRIGYFTFGIGSHVVEQLILIVSLAIMVQVLKKSLRFRNTMSVVTTSATDDSLAREKKSKANQASSEADKAKGGSANLLSDSKEMKVIIQVALVCIVFLICYTPRLILALSSLLEPRLDFHGSLRFLYNAIVIGVILLEHINASVNLFIFYKYNSKFRSVCFRR